MNLVMFSIRAKGPATFIKRLGHILARFGLTSAKMASCLRLYVETLERHGCRATFPITAVVLKRHRQLTRGLEKAEFAVHGYVHTDYSRLSPRKERNHIEKAVAIFQSCQLPFSGFRLPYLRASESTLDTLAQFPFTYTSNVAIQWDVLNKGEYDRTAWASYERALRFYDVKRASCYSSLPRHQGRLVEIPMSIPDDEALVDRLGVREASQIAEVWTRILERTYERGELFVLQLHPERIKACKEALEAVLARARQKSPPIWIATMAEIGHWWRELSEFELTVEPTAPGRYWVQAQCSPRATILAKGLSGPAPTPEFFGSYRQVAERAFPVEGTLRPIVGVPPTVSPSMQDFLTEIGYPVEVSEEGDKYSIYLDKSWPTDELGIMEKIDRHPGPLIRFWVWPERARSALAVTGDIDAVTLSDFVWRLWEVRST